MCILRYIHTYTYLLDRECGGGRLCEHKKRKHECIECGGVGLCPHKRRPKACHDCKMDHNTLCPHSRRRYLSLRNKQQPYSLPQQTH